MTNSTDEDEATITSSNDQALPSVAAQVQGGGDGEAAQPTTGGAINDSKPNEPTTPSSSITTKRAPVDAGMDQDGQGVARNEAATATAQGIPDSSMSQGDIEQPSSTKDKGEEPADASMDQQDQIATQDQKTINVEHAGAAADIDTSMSQQDVSQDKPSPSSSSSPLQGSLKAAERSIFDACRDLVTHMRSKDNETDKLLTSAFDNLEAAMKSVIVAQAAAATTPCNATQIDCEGSSSGVAIFRNDTPQGRQKRRRHSDVSAAKEAFSGLLTGYPALYEGGRGKAQALPPRQKQEQAQLPGGTTAPRQPMGQRDQPRPNAGPQTLDLCRILDAPALSAHPSNLVSTDSLLQSQPVQHYLDKLERIWPDIGATEFLDKKSLRCFDTSHWTQNPDAQRTYHADWALALHRMRRNSPHEQGKAVHFLMPGSPEMPLPRGLGAGPRPTVLRSVTRRPPEPDPLAAQQRQQAPRWSSLQLREHRL